MMLETQLQNLQHEATFIGANLEQTGRPGGREGTSG
jgi:hypothetical protein